MPAAHAKSPPPRSGSASTPPTTRCPNGNAPPNASGPHEFLSYVEGRAAMFAGLADSTLSRDDGYRFMVLGRAIERVDMTVRLLLSRVGDSASSPAWVTVLRSAGAHDTYLRTYRGVLDAGRVVEFMLLDRLFPRSVFYSLRLAEHSLDELHQPPAQPRRRHRGGAAAAGPGPQRVGVPPARACCWSRCEERLAALQKTCLRRRRGVGAAVLPLRAVGGVDRCGTQRLLVIEEGESLMWRHARGARDGLRLQVAGHRVVQRGPADPALGLPAERHPQPGRDGPRHPVLPLRRLLGHRGDGVRPARAAHRTGGDVVVGGRDRPAGARPRRRSRWDDLAAEAVIDRYDEVLAPTHYTPVEQAHRAGRRSASPSTTIPRRP